METLVRQWKTERELVQGHSLPARWSEMRYIFGHREEEPGAATRARYSISDCGPKTRERWEREYRCEREITRIMSNSTVDQEIRKRFCNYQIHFHSDKVLTNE
jgi:DNA-binding PadR family transcriptional regulator